MRPQVILPQYVLASAQAEAKARWGVVVSGDAVMDVGPAEALRAAHQEAEVVEAPGQALVPGLVNAHHHMYGALAHGIPVETAPSGFWSFLRDFWWPRVEDALTQEMIVAATDLACLEMVRSGVTSFYDCLEAPQAIPGALAAEAAVVRRWGLRGVLSFEATERAGAVNGELGLAENAGFVDECQRQGGLVRGMMCFHTSFTCGAPFIRRAVGLARDRGCSVHMHLSEGTYEPEYCLAHFGKRPVAYYDSLGALGPWTLASQCVHVDAPEIDVLAERGCRVAHMPMSNCEVGAGVAPVPALLAAGIPLGLGTDGYIANFLENMRWAFLVHKATLADPAAMPAATVWQTATSGGAAAVGVPQVGSLAPGQAADLVLLRLDTPTPVTAGNLRDQVLLWRNPADITGVMAAGRWLMRDGQVLGADEAAIHAHCREAANRLWGR